MKPRDEEKSRRRLLIGSSSKYIAQDCGSGSLIISGSSANDDSVGEEEVKFDDERAQEIFDKWMVFLRLDQC